MERWFAELTTRGLRRFAHRSVTALEAGFDGDHWSAASEVVAYDMAGEVAGGPAGAP